MASSAKPLLSFAQPPAPQQGFMAEEAGGAAGSWCSASAGPGSQTLEVRYHGPRMGAPPSDNLYVKGLPPSAAKPQVAALFAKFGSVIDMRLMPGPQDTAALVRMGSEAEAAFAIQELNGLHWDIMSSLLEGDPSAMPSGDGAQGQGESASPTGDMSWQSTSQSSARAPTLQFASPPPPLSSVAKSSSQLQVRFHGKGAHAPPSDNLYVKGLERDITEGDLMAMFSSAGLVRSVKIMPGSEDSIALVRMGSVQEADKAIRMLDTSGAAMPPNMPSFEVRFHGPRGSPPSDNLYVKGLPLNTTRADLQMVFSAFGTIIDMRIMPPANADVPDCTALVRMGSVQEAMAVVGAFNYVSGGASAASKGKGKQSMHFQEPIAPPYWMGMGAQTWRPNIGKGGAKGSGWSKGGKKGSGNLQLEVRFHGPRGAPPSDNLYVKGLPKDVTRDYVMQLFSSCGEIVDMRIMAGKGHQVQDAIALVRMASVEQATVAVEIFGSSATITNGMSNGQQGGPAGGWAPATEGPAALEGLEQPMSMLQERPALEIRYHGPRGAPPSDNLYVKGLPLGISETEVTQLFSEYGTVQRIRVMQPPPGAPDCTALVRMGSQEEADAAIAGLHSGPNRSSSSGHEWSSPY